MNEEESRRSDAGQTEAPRDRRRYISKVRAGSHHVIRWPSLLIASVLAGCSAVGTPLADLATEINDTRRSPPYAIVAGDLIDLHFPFRPDWNQTIMVRSDGQASLPGLGEFEIAGRSIAEVSKSLATAYRDITGSPQPELNPNSSRATEVGVSLAHQVFVIGEVTRPGAIPIGESPLSLVEALAKAGGPLKATANLADTLLVRWVPAENRRRAWHIDARVEHWETPVPVLLQPRDVVFVPNTAIDDVDIWVDQYIRRMLPLPFFPLIGP